jgi:alginate O-acetyltransferase complex protein AlgI
VLQIMQPTNPGYVIFLAVVTFIFFWTPHRFRWVWLLVASLTFYFSIVPFWLAAVYLAGATLVSYLCGLGMGRYKSHKKAILAVGVVLNIGLLVVVKYLDFFLSEMGRAFQISMPQFGIKLPPGLSFYIFMTITYMVDIYRGKMEADQHLGHFAAYIAYFPKILAGPIERARTFLPQLRKKVRFDAAMATEGWQLILLGLIKKMVLADRLAPFVKDAYSSVDTANPISLVLATYFFMIQVYGDFSGYTDMARGTAKLVGLDLMDNFKRPFLSKSTSEFWGRRWHISLGSWFKDYMYIPMGGSRCSWPRRYFNSMMVFIVSGFWHAGLGYGVNWSFMVWGALNGFYQWVAVATKPIWTACGVIFPKAKDNRVLTFARILMTFNLIVFTQIFFRASSMGDAMTILNRVYKGFQNLPMLLRNYNVSTELWISFAFIALLAVWEILDERKSMWERLKTKPLAFRWAAYYALIVFLITMGKWGEAEFIYMQF